MNSLCLDFGNTRLKYAIFQKDILVKQEAFESAETVICSLEKLHQQYSFSKSVLSSVIAHDTNVEKWLSQYTRFHCVGADTKTNFSTASIRRSIEMGADRIALCCGAINEQKTKKEYILIICLGTCITYNFIDLRNTFLGGGISPGLSMRYKSMHDLTALLPLLHTSALRITPPLIGYDTDTNLHSGVLYGVASEIDGMIARYKEWYSQLAVYITGGDADYLLPHLKSKIFADSDLLMKGLHWILNENC